MPHHAHDVRLMPGRIEGVLHGLAIERQRIVLRPPGPIPVIERPIQRPRFNTYQAIANSKKGVSTLYNNRWQTTNPR